MKVVAKPVEMVAWFENEGAINPIRFRIEDKNNKLKVIKIDKILFKDKEKIAGNLMLIFRCSSIIDGRNKVYELKYEIDTCKWILFKIE